MVEYRFRLFGVAALLRLGKGGNQLKSTVNGIEARNPADDALVPLRSADPSLPEDAVPLGFADNRYSNKISSATGQRAVRTNASGIIEESAVAIDEDGNVTIPGNLNVQGTTVTFDTETVRVEDKNIELANSATTDAEADGGGIDLKGAVTRFMRWILSRDAWVFSENIDLEPGKEYRVNGSEYLSTRSTDDLPEGATNKYLSDANLGATNSDALPEGSTNLYFSILNRDAWWATKNTDSLPEGTTNFYFNTYRVRGIFQVIDLVGHGFVADQVLARDLSDDSLVLADPTVPDRSRPLGIVAVVVGPDQLIMLSEGWLQRSAGNYGFDGIAYLSDLAPGAVTDTPPATGVATRLGQIDATGLFHFRPLIDSGTAAEFIAEFEAGLTP